MISKENFIKIKRTSLLIESHLQQKSDLVSIQLDKLIVDTREFLENPLVQDDLNESIFWLHKRNEIACDFFNVLMECLMTYLEQSESKCDNNSLKIIEIISSLRLRQLLVIKSTLLTRLLEIMDKNEDIQILNIILRLSENQFYEKINFSSPMNRLTTIELINKKILKNETIKNEIILNLNQKSLREQLDYLNSMDLNENVLSNDETFLANLNSLSLTLNQQKSRFLHGELLLKNNTISFCVKLFALQIRVLKKSFYEMECEKFCNSFKCILEILFKIIRSPLNMEDRFLEQGILESFYILFESNSLLRLLYERYLNFFIRLISIFFHLMRAIHFKRSSIEDYRNTISFDLLERTRDLFEELYMQGDSTLMKEKPFFRIYLRSLGYVSEIFKPKVQLLNTCHYEFIATRSFISCYFNCVRKDFIDACDLMFFEFVNELNEIELEKVNRFNEYQNGFRKNTNYYFVEVLIWLKNLFTCFESIRIVYDTHQFFFKSIVYFGLDIEKLLCLHVLAKFSYGNDGVGREIFQDKQFIEFIERINDDININ